MTLPTTPTTPTAPTRPWSTRRRARASRTISKPRSSSRPPRHREDDALVERILSLLRSGKATLRTLVAVTFTEKAAGEMKLRLRTEIEKSRSTATDPVEQGRLNEALRQLEAAHIGTIHAFCADMLRERPVEAEVDPLFEVASEDESERLYDEAFTRWFQETLQAPGEGVSRVLRRATRERDQDGPRSALRKAGRNLIEQRDFPTRTSVRTSIARPRSTA